MRCPVNPLLQRAMVFEVLVAAGIGRERRIHLSHMNQ
jgi:hypothetical protein